MTPNETALEDAKNVLESDIVDNVGDAAVNKPHEKMNEAKSNVIDHEDASKTKTQNPTVFGEFFRTTTSSEGEFDEHHHQSLQAMALRKEVLDKRQGRPNQPAVTDAGPLQQIENVQGENEAAVDAVNGSNNFNPVLKASANQQEQHTTSNIEKVLQLKQSIDSIVRSSKASHGANIVAFPELVRPELGAPAATKTAEYPELPQTDGRSEVSTGAATKPTGYPETSPQPPKNPKVAARKPGMAKNPIAIASNPAAQSMGPPGVTGGNDPTQYPSILGKRTLPSQKGEPSKPTKKRSTVKFDLPTPPSKKGGAKSKAKAPSAPPQQGPATLGAAVSTAKSKKKSGTPKRPTPCAFPNSIPAHLVNPPGLPSYASIIAAAPLNRPAILLGDDLARARGLDPLVPLANPALDRFNRRPHLEYPNVMEQPVPQTWSEAEQPDRMLFLLQQMDADWESITLEWYRLTGTWPVGDVLPQRLARFKDNMTVLKPGDTQRLLNAAHDVEADYRSSKWNMIADRLVEYGGGDYTTTFLQRKHLELDFEKQLEKGWGS
ncbi:MAG: hypothetical protein LQ347_002094 [Umbilicaria vellea]|nr:MAG: hypothetical protein LQ347_002094 [Umbilicaria vellea]